MRGETGPCLWLAPSLGRPGGLGVQGPVKVRQLKQSKESLSWYWLFLKNLANLGS
jgi:hypothetical protein